LNARLRLVTRGDDSGSCHSANRAIRDGFTRGILRNTSLMVPGPAFDEAARMLAGLDGLGFGLHATITDEWNESRWGPVLGAKQVPSLVMDDGTFYKSTTDLWNHKPNLDEILAELKAQLKRARSRGLAVSYIDEHMVFSWFHGLQEKLHAFAKAEGLVYGHGLLPGLPEVKGDFADPVERFIARLSAAEPGKTYLLVTHPAYADAEMRAMTYDKRAPGEIARERDCDRRLLTDPRVLDYCSCQGVQLARFADI
jgi:hypothetical protein